MELLLPFLGVITSTGRTFISYPLFLFFLSEKDEIDFVSPSNEAVQTRVNQPNKEDRVQQRLKRIEHRKTHTRESWIQSRLGSSRVIHHIVLGVTGWWYDAGGRNFWFWGERESETRGRSSLTLNFTKRLIPGIPVETREMTTAMTSISRSSTVNIVGIIITIW